MEPFGAAASAIAIIHLGIKSIHTAREFLAACEDKPEPVAQLEKDLASLSVVLERLSQCPLETSSPTTVSSLKLQLNDCNAELSKIESLLRRWDKTPGGAANRLRNGFRTVFLEKDLERARSQLRDIRVQLNLYLEVLQAEATANISSINANNANATGNVLQHILSSLGRVHDRLDNADATATSTASGVVETYVMQACSELEESVERLGSLVDHHGSTLEAEDAEQIVDDLRALLGSARDHVLFPNRGPSAKNSPQEGEENKRGLTGNLRLIEGLLLGAPVVAVNQPGVSRRNFLSQTSSSCAIRQKRSREDIEFGNGIVTITSNKRQKVDKGSTMSSLAPNKCHKDTIATLLFRPAKSSLMVALSVAQGQLIDHSVQSISRISINPIIPRDSQVFKFVQDGRLDEFRAMLTEGQTSVRVHDEIGMGLLQYAVSQPHMCQFLIEAGAEVDYIGGDRSPLLMAVEGDHRKTVQILLEHDADPLLRVLIRYFLPEEYSSPFETASDQCSASVMGLYWHYSSHFFRDDINTYDPTGLPALLRACGSTIGSPLNRAVLTVLANMGAEFGARAVGIGKPFTHNRWPGFTALHTLAYAAHDPLSRDELESFVFLVNKGISVHALDDTGRTVSMVAYSVGCSDYYLGGYRGDLWDAALVICGLNLEEFRKDYPRVARYGPWYNRHDFERLWRGMERFCPYWDDRRWPETGGDSEYGFRDIVGISSRESLSPEPDDEEDAGSLSPNSQESSTEDPDPYGDSDGDDDFS